MKHLIIFSIIIIGVVFLKLLSDYSKQNIVINDCLIPGVYVGESSIGGKYGRGVFANRDFSVGEIIERSSYIEDKLDNFIGVSRDYVFNTPNGKTALVFGYASLYNHSDDPDVIWYFEDKRMIIKTIKSINKGKEIFISYGVDYWKSRKNTIKLDK